MQRLILAAVAALAVAVFVASPAAARSTVASWYGPGLYGNRLACGGRLYASSFGVAHRSLPCGSRVTVCYRGRCARSYVADRGPFVSGREFDLGPGLARYLGFSGVQRVSVF